MLRCEWFHLGNITFLLYANPCAKRWTCRDEGSLVSIASTPSVDGDPFVNPDADCNEIPENDLGISSRLGNMLRVG